MWTISGRRLRHFDRTDLARLFLTRKINSFFDIFQPWGSGTPRGVWNPKSKIPKSQIPKSQFFKGEFEGALPPHKSQGGWGREGEAPPTGRPSPPRGPQRGPKIQNPKSQNPKIPKTKDFGPKSMKIGFDRLCQGLKIDFLPFGTSKNHQNPENPRKNRKHPDFGGSLTPIPAEGGLW